MKQLNRLAAALLAAIMVLGLSGTAFASERGGYTDVPEWAEEYVDTVTELGLLDGRSETAFAPDEQATRAELVVALYRLAGARAPEGAENPFTDLEGLNDEQKAAIAWAKAEGIVGGKTDTSFDPNGSILRQELAKLLSGFAAWKVKAEALTGGRDLVSGYPDAASVESWAKAPMSWALDSGFIKGTGGRLDPNGTATRAQVAAILCRYIDYMHEDTGDAARDNPRNEAPSGEKELLVVSFGTSYNDNRVATIGAIESAMEEAFADYDVRRGFTADTIIKRVLLRDGEKIDNVQEALDKAVSAGVKELLVQPTHLMNGYEYGDLRSLLEKKYADKFESISIGAPLLTSERDFADVAIAMINAAKDAVKDGKTAVCYMGHGTSADSHSVYARMQEELKAAGYNNYFVGTVEAAPTAADLVELVKEGGYEKVVLRPMMIVAGDHANNDMAGDEEDSWKSVFEAAGLKVDCQISGLGELEEIRQLLVEHAKNARPLSDTGIISQPNPENPDSEEPEAGTLADGVYTIEVECAQAMFKVESCELTVKDGRMTAVLTLGSASFDKMFAGTEAAARLAREGALDGTEADGRTTFTLPVEALDRALDYAAHSVKKDEWYDRTLTFVSATAAAK